MKRRLVQAIAVCMLLLLPVTAQAINETPSSQDALIAHPTLWTERESTEPVKALLNQGYVVTKLLEPYLVLPPSVPNCTLDKLKESMQAGLGVFILITHGDENGFMFHTYRNTSQGTQAAYDAIDDYVYRGVVPRDVLSVQFFEYGVGIMVDKSLVNAWGNNKNTLVVNRACNSHRYCNSWRANCVLDYNYEVFTTVGLDEIDSLFTRLDGSWGLSKRSVKNARIGGISMYHCGDDEMVLAPSLVSFTDADNHPITSLAHFSSITPALVKFNCKMNRVNWWDALEATTSHGAVCQGKWSDSNTLSFKLVPVSSGEAKIRLDASYLEADGDGGFHLDGDNVGPNGDDAMLSWYSDGGDNDCQATGLGPVWVSDTLGVRTFNWVTEMESRVAQYEILGEPGDVVLATALPAGEPFPRAYSAQVPAGYEAYVLRETEIGGRVLKDRPIVAGTSLLSPAQLQQLRNNTTTATRTVMAPLLNPLSTNIEDGGTGGGSGPAIVDYVLFGPDSLLATCEPIKAWWQAHGISSRWFTTLSPDPEPVRAQLAIIAAQANQAGLGLPRVGLIGDASEDDATKNILATYSTPDTIGCAFFGANISTDDPYGDVNGDGISEFDLFRIPGHRVADVTHSAETYLLSLEPERSAQRQLLMLVGDVELGGLSPAGSIASADATQAEYAQVGYGVTRKNDSDYPGLDLVTRQNDVVRYLNSGIQEVWTRGPLSNRSRFPGDFIQKTMTPTWDTMRLTSARPFILWAIGCDMNDFDRSNPIYDPILVEDLMFRSRLVCSVSSTRGGYGVGHDLMNAEFVRARFSGAKDALEVFWRAKREFVHSHWALRQYAQGMVYLGWPAPLPEYQQVSGIAEKLPGPTLGLTTTPNPSRGPTKFNFELPQSGNVQLSVFDIAGRLVRTVFDGPRASGLNQVVWDGRRDNGQAVASGLYLARCQVDGGTLAARIIVLR